jgi:hypothetical protein
MLLQEYYIRHLDANAATSVADRDRLRRALEAAIQRRHTDVTPRARALEPHFPSNISRSRSKQVKAGS